MVSIAKKYIIKNARFPKVPGKFIRRAADEALCNPIGWVYSEATFAREAGAASAGSDGGRGGAQDDAGGVLLDIIGGHDGAGRRARRALLHVVLLVCVHCSDLKHC